MVISKLIQQYSKCQGDSKICGSIYYKNKGKGYHDRQGRIKGY